MPLMTTVESLPPRQREVLALIQQLTEEQGYPPTLAELAKALGLKNRMTIHQHVVALKKKGMVRWEPGLNRSLRVLNPDELGEEEQGSDNHELQDEPQPASRGIPLAGTIAAGHPLDAFQTDEFLEVDAQYGEKGCFALKIKGDSMIDDGIYDGDFVIIKPEPSPRNGEIVVATLSDGTATLKRFFKENGRFRLQPANSTMQPIIIDAKEQLEIQGIVVALFRKMS
jgi:repressor LexA